jgi:hypothetical protein
MAFSKALMGVYPISSFMHVPKKMPAPVWLMLGTAFAVDTGNLALSDAFRARHPTLLVTAGHTFSPWKQHKLNIPEEWCRLRYMVARCMAFDQNGAADAALMADMTVVAAHPKLDVCVLAPTDAAAFAAMQAKHRASVGLDGEGAMPDPFRLARPVAGASGTFTGFRGRGTLGDPSTMPSEEEAKTMSDDEKRRLVAEQRGAFGRQDGSIISARPRFTDDGAEVGHAAVSSGRVYSGMSGCPFVSSSDRAVHGVLTSRAFIDGDGAAAEGIEVRGSQEDRPYDIVYVPSGDIIDWLETMK